MSAVILLIDDDQVLPIVLSRALSLKELDSDIRCVSDGQDGINYLSRKNQYADDSQFPFPSVVLLDLSMTVVNGFKVLEWKREQACLASLPVIVWSSSILPEDEHLARALGACDYLVKPMNLGELLAIFRSLAQRFPQSGTVPDSDRHLARTVPTIVSRKLSALR